MVALALGVTSAWENDDNFDLSAEDVSDFPHSKYSRTAIAKAGGVIASDNVFPSSEVPDDIRQAFLIANNWRNAHAFPMRSIRASVSHHIRKNDLLAITAARLKRMDAIRRKLRRINVPLHKLQDLGGCRVILATIADTRALVDVLKSRLPSVVIKEDDYIAKPKVDGYRSHHLIFSFRRPERTPFDDKLVELQIRTHLQHSWATTVEAVGLYRGEELKNQRGSKDWLRLFALMSSEFAEAENCSMVPGTPGSKERKVEIRNLAGSLDALSVLEAVTNGFRGPDILVAPEYKPSHYLIRFDQRTKTVHVEPYRQANKATVAYGKAEEVQRAGDQNDAIVLVEVDKINNLKAAYPNYFGDVELFQRQLRQIVLGGAAVEYARPPKQKMQTRPRELRADLSWLRGAHFPGPSAKKMRKKKRR